MKKTLIALAALASTAAFAQSTVTLSGAFGVGIQNTAADSKARWNMTNGDITVRAIEDLGGGLKANAGMSVTTEGQRSGNVTVEFATFSLSGNFGSFAYSNVLSGRSKLSAGVSAEDDMSDMLGGYTPVDVVAYTTPELIKGLTLTLEQAGPTAGSADQRPLNTKPTFIVNYAMGPFKVYYDLPNGSDWGEVRAWYNAGGMGLGARITDGKEGGGQTTELIATAGFGAVSLGAHYAKNDVGDGFGLAVGYALSKRTSLGVSFVDGTFGAGTKANASGSNYRIQMAHTF
jgi:hypothetical protein